MARPRTPTLKLEGRGGFDKHPERKRARANEPVVKRPLGEPPEGLNVLHVADWRDLADWGSEWLTIADRFQVEIACRAMEAYRATGDKGQGMLAQAALAKCGFNPVDRTRVMAEGGKSDGSRDKAEAYFGA